MQYVGEHGFVRPRDIEAIGLPREYLVRLHRQGKLNRPARGIYTFPDADRLIWNSSPGHPEESGGMGEGEKSGTDEHLDTVPQWPTSFPGRGVRPEGLFSFAAFEDPTKAGFRKTTSSTSIPTAWPVT